MLEVRPRGWGRRWPCRGQCVGDPVRAVRQRAGDDPAVLPAGLQACGVGPRRLVAVPQSDPEVDQRATQFHAALPADAAVPAAKTPSRWSARSAARTNDLDRVESRRTMERGRERPERTVTFPPSQLRSAVPPWTVRRVGSDAVEAMAHRGDAVSSSAPDPSPSNGSPYDARRPAPWGGEFPRHVRRLHSLGRMESCREIQRSGTRRS